MYYVLTCPADPHKKLADFFLDDRFDESWYTGEKLSERPPNPLELTWDPKNENGVRTLMYSLGIVLMVKELVEALREASVKNIETYPVVIKSKRKKSAKAGSKAPPAGDCTDYLAVNVIGVTSAVDKKKSVFEDDGFGNIYFESLVIDEKKAKGKPLFRLQESLSTLLIHEDVVKHLKEKGGFGLTFVDPADYTG